MTSVASRRQDRYIKTSPVHVATRAVTPRLAMRAETQADIDAIKQSVGLLRRHL
jgi:hypothetical protein